MSQSRPLFIGMEVHQATMAVAYVAPDPGAAGTSLGPIGPRQCASAHLVRTRPAQATPLVLVDAAGPCGDWR
jgi:hypothetical protein